MQSEKTIEHHSIPQSVLLHLLPGILTGGLYWGIVPWIVTNGYPSGFALILSGVLVLYPYLAIVLVRKRKQGLTWREIIPYRQALSLNSYLVWIFGLFVVSGMTIALLGPVSGYVGSLFTWIPQVLHPNMEVAQAYTGEYSLSVLFVSIVFGFVFISTVGPILEELYFRGFLLPRIPPMGGFSPLFHSFLFASYHVWSPLLIPARTIAVLPLIYAVQKKENIYLGVWTHCLLNATEFVIGAVVIGRLFFADN